MTQPLPFSMSGCGSGNLTAGRLSWVTEGKVVGVDIASGVASQATKAFPSETYPDLPFVTAHSLTSLFPGTLFDIVHTQAVLLCCNDPAKALQEVKRVCKPGGLVATRDNVYPTMIETLKPRMPGVWQGFGIIHKVLKHGGIRMDVGRRKPQWILRLLG